MRLISATVRSYRLHEDLTVHFDDARTLIGGANETGKSTLVEAIHRALFLKATVTGEPQESMRSNTFPGHPEVEVRFLAGGNEYHLSKRFSGQNGTARLVRVGGETWHGAEAEAQLAALLGVTEPGGGRGVLGRVQQQWSHIWVWQGKSGEDPSCLGPTEQQNLLKELQESGGAITLQSLKDGRVAFFFREKRAEIYTQAGSPKRNSDLAQAQQALAEATKDLQDAEERLRRLARAVEDLEEATTAIERAKCDLVLLTGQRQELTEKTRRIDELRKAEDRQASAFRQAREGREAKETVEEDIRALRDSVRALEGSLAPMREEQDRLTAGVTASRDRKEAAEQAYDRAVDVTRVVRPIYELAGAYVALFDKEGRCEQLRERLNTVKRLQDESDELRHRIAALGSIDQDALDSLRAVERDLGRARAGLLAMATEVEVVSADRTVLVAETVLPPGASETVSDPTEVRIGEGVTLRIRPGGGDNLLRAREEADRLQDELGRALAERGLQSIEQAADLVADRAALESRLLAAESGLKQWKPSELETDYKAVQSDLAELCADIGRRRELIGEVEEPPTREAAVAWHERERDRLAGSEMDEAAARAERDTVRQLADEAERALSAFGKSLDEDEQQLAASRIKLELLLDTNGPDEERTDRLEAARRAEAEAEAQLFDTRRRMAALQPDLLEADQDRLERALEENRNRRQDAEIRSRTSQAMLRSDGSGDPTAAVVDAQARRDRAEAHLARVSRKAEAVALIDDLFQEEQRALADQFSQPLADRIDSYLQCLFGQDSHARVTFEENEFKGMRLVRAGEDGADSFDTLSGGTREQVAAAVRLAIAELLAGEHDNSLPIVFDDAFAYSDPERVQTLQRMLDLAARRGLQVIVLTCNPSDYAGLGAKQIGLN